MDFSRKNHFSPILSLLFIASTVFFISNAAAEPSDQGFNCVSESTRRYLDEASNGSTTLVLAADRTHRRDPIDDFKFYSGGWNITNEHYVASVVFSAAPLFITAIIWFLVFGICLFCMCLRRCCCCRKKHYTYSRKAYALSLILIIVFTIIAIWGSVYIYYGQSKFQNSTVAVMSYVLKKADTVVKSLKDVFDLLLSAKNIAIGQLSLPSDSLTSIDNMEGQINSTSDAIRQVTSMSSDDIRNFTDPLRTTLIYVTAFMLILAFLGLLLSVLGLQCIVFILMIIGWIAVVGTFIMSGVFIFVHNASSDTCVAMTEFLQNPTAHSALERIIPKADHQTAQDIMKGTKSVTFGLVNITNTVIANVYNKDLPPDAEPLYANRTGPLMPILCNLFNDDLTSRQCAKGEVDYNNATEVWKKYICQSSESGICTTPGRLTLTNYNELIIPVNISHSLFQYGPFLVDLIDSTYVKDTFSGISRMYCPSLVRSSGWIYTGFAIISSSVMLSLVFWVIYARERRHRKSTKKLLASPRGREFEVMGRAV